MSFTSLLKAGAAYTAGQSAKKAGQLNAETGVEQSNLAINQGAQAENLVRRNSREDLGKQAAAIGAAGGGYGGSSGLALQQSAVNQELDALNTRYKGAISSWGYGRQSYSDLLQARSAEKIGNMTAAAALLSGFGDSYSSGRGLG